MKKCISILFACCAIAGETAAMKGSLSQRITLKTPGNRAVTYNLRETAEGGGILEADRRLPLTVRRQKTAPFYAQMQKGRRDGAGSSP